MFFSLSRHANTVCCLQHFFLCGERRIREVCVLVSYFPLRFVFLFCLCCCCCCYLLCVVSYSSFLRASVSVSVMYTIVYSAVRFGRRRWMHTPNMVIPYRLTNSYVTRKRTKHTHTQQPTTTECTAYYRD